MTTYVTEEDFEEAFGRRELDDLLAGGADFARVEATSGGIIDGYLAARYALPLAAVPAMLKAWALDIVRFRLWDDAAPEEVRRRYEDALAQLRDLARGVIALPPDATGAQASAPLQSDGYCDERIFTSNTLAGF